MIKHDTYHDTLDQLPHGARVSSDASPSRWWWKLLLLTGQVWRRRRRMGPPGHVQVNPALGTPCLRPVGLETWSPSYPWKWGITFGSNSGTCAHCRVHENLNIYGFLRPTILHPLQPTTPFRSSCHRMWSTNVIDKSKTMLKEKFSLAMKW